MKGALETMFGILVIAFMAVLGTSYITAALNTQRAQNFHSAVISEVEASDFSNEVITDLNQKAKDNGYTSLAVDVNTAKTGKEYAKVTLSYKYSIPLLSVDKTNEIVGYAR